MGIGFTALGVILLATGASAGTGTTVIGEKTFAEQLTMVCSATTWAPSGGRSVGGDRKTQVVAAPGRRTTMSMSILERGSADRAIPTLVTHPKW